MFVLLFEIIQAYSHKFFNGFNDTGRSMQTIHVCCLNLIKSRFMWPVHSTHQRVKLFKWLNLNFLAQISDRLNVWFCPSLRPNFYCSDQSNAKDRTFFCTTHNFFLYSLSKWAIGHLWYLNLGL